MKITIVIEQFVNNCCSSIWQPMSACLHFLNHFLQSMVELLYFLRYKPIHFS